MFGEDKVLAHGQAVLDTLLQHQGGDAVAKSSSIDNVLKYQAQYEEAKKSAIAELLKQRKDIDTQLRALGHNTPAGNSAAGPVKRGAINPNKPCPVCGEMGHDARRHRGEAKGSKKR